MKWEFMQEGTYYPRFYISDEDLLVIADGIKDKKHAQLIAAAPDMLAALEELLSYVDPHDHNLEKFYQIIAKAKGGDYGS